jgi:ABC-type transport system involved in multi-copper enzyme maturation permease subunit
MFNQHTSLIERMQQTILALVVLILLTVVFVTMTVGVGMFLGSIGASAAQSTAAGVVLGITLLWMIGKIS